MKAHPTAVVHPRAKISGSVEIGPYSVIGEHVEIGEGTVVANHVTITGHTMIGKNNSIAPYAVIGTEPQDIKFRGEKTIVQIGDGNVIREFVTINLGTELGGRETVIGNDNLIMAYCHVAHDCIIDDHVIIANSTGFAGHVKIESYARIGGMAAVHHFVTIGRLAFVGGFSRIAKDVPPFMTVEGNPARVRCVNLVGIKRAGLAADRIEAIKGAHRIIFREELNLEKACRKIQDEDYLTEEVACLLESLRNTARGRYGRAREALRKDLELVAAESE